MAARTHVDLSGVPETLLWTLYHRAVEARRPDAVLDDPKAVELVGRLDYPFEERFGSRGALGQWQALRVACFDREIRRFLAQNPGGTVVALGEGLETQFWRVDDGTVNWIGVDVPERWICERACCRTPSGAAASRARRSIRAGWTRSTRPGRCSSPRKGCSCTSSSTTCSG